MRWGLPLYRGKRVLLLLDFIHGFNVNYLGTMLIPFRFPWTDASVCLEPFFPSK